jgi:integrase
MTLGNYPERDPLLEKQAVVEQQRAAIAAQRAQGTFRELAEDWYETEIEGQRLKHPQVPWRHLDNYLLPEFDDRVPAEITPADAGRLLAKVSSGPERKRRRALSRGELEGLFKALGEAQSFGGGNFLAIKLLLALGVRKGELLKATRGEFDFEGDGHGSGLATAWQSHKDQ